MIRLLDTLRDHCSLLWGYPRERRRTLAAAERALDEARAAVAAADMTCRLTLGLREDAYQRGRSDERAAVVAWLRECDFAWNLGTLPDMIENTEHLEEPCD